MQRTEAIDATHALLRATCGLPPRARPPAIPAIPAGAWPDIVTLTSTHLVLPALAPGLAASGLQAEVPADAAGFVAFVHDANHRRNRQLVGAIRDLAASFNARGICPVLLKGAGFLTDDGEDRAAWRFMADIDLLVPAPALADCVALCRARGYTRSGERYDPARHAHYAPLISPCGTFSVELHTRLFARHDIGLGFEEMRRAGDVIALTGAQAIRPAPAHRLAHLLAHSQLHNRYWQLNRVLFRDFCDLASLARLVADDDWRAALGHFRTGRELIAVKGLLAAWQSVMPELAAVGVTNADRAWAGRALARLARPRWQRSALAVGETLMMEAREVLATPSGRARIRETLREPGRLADWASRRRIKLGHAHWS